MFLFRWIKRLVILALFGLLIWWGANYKVNGRPLYQSAKDILASENFRQGWKDLKMMIGGLLKSLGEEIQEEVTEEDRKELESMIKKKMKEGYGNDSHKKLQNSGM